MGSSGAGFESGEAGSQSPDELQAKFGLNGAVRFEGNTAGLVRAVVSGPQAEGVLSLQGAHLTAWTPRGEQRPVLFLSERSEFVPGKAIRGGVPVIFPWFGARSDGGKGPSHGFARTLPWELEGTELRSDGSVALRLRLTPNETTAGLGFPEFELRYTVVMGRVLELLLEARNTTRQALRLEEALHSYFAVSEIRQVTVAGLESAAFLDNAEGRAPKQGGPAPIAFAGETDRLYIGTEAACTIEDPGWKRRIVVEKSGSRSTVVWNPWAKKAEELKDLGDAWPGMVCVETANAAADAVTLAPGAAHTMRARVQVESLGLRDG